MLWVQFCVSITQHWMDREMKENYSFSKVDGAVGDGEIITSNRCNRCNKGQHTQCLRARTLSHNCLVLLRLRCRVYGNFCLLNFYTLNVHFHAIQQFNEILGEI